MLWHIPNSKPITNQDDLVSQLIKNREISDLDFFLNPPHPSEISPKDVGISSKELTKAVTRIKSAIKNQEKVVIYGDYDADGITATSIVWLTLNKLGLTTKPFIPDRLKHGYGLSLKAIKEILSEEKPDLIITVDNGVTAKKELEYLSDQKVDVIVTDHHQLAHQDLPTHALVHSLNICGAGVAWMLVKELDETYSQSLLDLLAIATVADQVPLLDANRSFVKFGLELLKKETRTGLSALYNSAEIKPKSINTGTIGFQIAPRINAAGRVAHGITAARLLCTQNKAAAYKLAKQLESLNQDRQGLTEEQYKLAFEQASQQSKQKILIVQSDQFHEGVIGLLSGKLTEVFYKPSIAIATEGEVVKASARSVSGVNITNLIKKIETDLRSVGGHKLAAGFSAEKTKLATVVKNLIKLAEDEVDQSLLIPSLKIDAEIVEELVTKDTIQLLEKFEPFGIGNPKPVLAFKNCMVVNALTMGKEKNHLRLAVRTNANNYQALTAVGWSMADLLEKIQESKTIDLAFSLDLNRWNGRETVQLMLKDINLQSGSKIIF